MLKIAVCDDDFYIHEQIKEMVHLYRINQDREYTINCYLTAAELLTAPFDYNILFLDIMLDHDQDGIEVGKILRERKNSALFILTSSRIDRAVEGYKATTFRYLPKPITQVRLDEILDDAIEYMGFASEIFVAKFKYRTNYIAIRDLMYIESYYRKRYITSSSGEFQTTDSWEKIEEQINVLKYLSVFFRPRKTFLINLMHVVGNSKNAVFMSNGKTIAFENENKYHAFSAAYSIYLAR